MGDLVIVFTLKEFATKFTKQGSKPYVISIISSNGAIKLSNLEGEDMPNWISGCRIKHYKRLLTQEQLDKLHQSKWRNAKKEL